MHYRQSPDAFAEITNNEIMLLEVNTNEMYRSNEIGAIIWENLDGQHTLEEIVQEIMDVCIDVKEDVVRRDVEVFLEDLKEKGLVHTVEGELISEVKEV